MLNEPLVHFFLLAAGLFLVHRLVVGDARTIQLSAGTRADLTRHFRDQAGRAPSASELEAALHGWQREEALYREAVREGLERDDAAIRTVLIDKMRARAMAQVSPRAPTAQELEHWLAAHRQLYESPRRYTIAWLSFSRREARASAAREALEQALHSGKDPRFLGQPLYGATLTENELREKLGAPITAKVESMPRHEWQRLENEEQLFLVRLDSVEGGLPPLVELQPRLVVDWSQARREAEAQQILEQIAARYRLEESH